jgi:hypothetical protein
VIGIDSQEISNLPTKSAMEGKLHQNIMRAVNDFLEDNRTAIKKTQAIPANIETSNKVGQTGTTINGSELNRQAMDFANQEEYLEALIEQYTQVEFFIKEAKEQRMFDTVRSLNGNMKEITKEIANLELQLYGSSKFALSSPK